MISSEPRLNVLAELVMNASIKPSSTPASARRITWASGDAPLMLGGRVFSVETGLIAASETPLSAVESANTASSSAAGWAAKSDSAAGLITAAVLDGELEACKQPPARGSTSKASPRRHVPKIRFFIMVPLGYRIFGLPVIPNRLY